jgi:hypothetical protein
MKNDWWFLPAVALFTQIGFQQIGLKNTIFSACHSHPPYSPDLPPDDFDLFPTIKEKLELIQLADEDQFLSACKRF